MDLEKRYFNGEGDPCDILEVIKESPNWAANRIQMGEKAIKELEALKAGAQPVYVVGTNLPYHPMKWSLVGIFAEEKDAIAICKYANDFYTKLPLNADFQYGGMDCIRPKYTPIPTPDVELKTLTMKDIQEGIA